MTEITRILSDIEQGNPQAAKDLLPLVYEELHKLAVQKMAQEKPGQTLQATALVHEAYLKLVDSEKIPQWNSRGHFFAAAAEAMRRILVENARRKKSCKHGGNRQRRSLEEVVPIAEENPQDLLELDEALDRLAEEDPVKANLVQLRYFAGMSIEEAAHVLGISRATAVRYWSYAKVWLLHAIMEEDKDSTS